MIISLHVYYYQSDGGSILKIGEHLAKLWARVGCPVLAAHDWSKV